MLKKNKVISYHCRHHEPFKVGDFKSCVNIYAGKPCTCTARD